MKERDAKVDGGHTIVLYVEKDDHTYGTIQTGAFMAKNYLSDFYENRARIAEKCRARLTQGEISPVAYHMTLLDIGEADLASRAGVSCRALRRHMTPGGFAGMTLSMAARYAEVFDIPVADLFQVWRPHAAARVRREKTSSPLVVVTEVERASK